MHTKTSRKIDASSTNNQRIVEEAHAMSSLVAFRLQSDDATQQNTQYEFTLMNLNLNEIINRFFALSIIIDKRSHFQKSTNASSAISRRSFSVMQMNSSQDNVNTLTILRYRFKSSSRLKKSLKKSLQTSYQSNSNTQNIQNEIE
jgi:hypothetical protein